MMANGRRRLSAAQLQVLVVLALDGTQAVPNVSANWYVKQGCQIIATVRWETLQALAKAGFISRSDQPGAYHITDAGRAALAEAKATQEGTKESPAD